MDKTKIIHVLHHSYSPFADKNFEIGFWEEDWHAQVAQQTLKLTNKYDIECYRPERRADRIYAKNVHGVTHKVFPSIYYRWGWEYSPSLIRELRKENKKRCVVVHVHGIHNLLSYLIIHAMRKVPIVAQHHGDSPPLVKFERKNNPFLLILGMMEKRLLRHVDFFFVLTKKEKEVISQLVNLAHISIQTMGINFERCKQMDKMMVREKLSLPANKKIILYVGRFDVGKGIDIIIKAFGQLKKRYDVELVMIGGSRKDRLYEECKKSGAILIGRIPNEELIPYYSAADVYLLPSFKEDSPYELFGGIGVAPIESLACGTPIVSTTLKHFPTNKRIQLGKIPKNKNDVVRCISEILDNPLPFNNCREVVKKYYDWNTIIKNTVEIYDKLIEKYYL